MPPGATNARRTAHEPRPYARSSTRAEVVFRASCVMCNETFRPPIVTDHTNLAYRAAPDFRVIMSKFGLDALWILVVRGRASSRRDDRRAGRTARSAARPPGRRQAGRGRSWRRSSRLGRGPRSLPLVARACTAGSGLSSLSVSVSDAIGSALVEVRNTLRRSSSG